jgi:hypothetical protein
MKFAKILMPESLKKFIIFFFKKKTLVFLKFWQDLIANSNGIYLSETFGKVITAV